MKSTHIYIYLFSVRHVSVEDIIAIVAIGRLTSPIGFISSYVKRIVYENNSTWEIRAKIKTNDSKLDSDIGKLSEKISRLNLCCTPIKPYLQRYIRQMVKLGKGFSYVTIGRWFYNNKS